MQNRNGTVQVTTLDRVSGIHKPGTVRNEKQNYAVESRNLSMKNAALVHPEIYSQAKAFCIFFSPESLKYHGLSSVCVPGHIYYILMINPQHKQQKLHSQHALNTFSTGTELFFLIL